MIHQDKSIYSTPQIKKQNRRSYNKEQNEFILNCTKIINVDTKKQKWNEIAKLFKNRFPSIKPERTPKELLDHFEHSIDKSIKRGPISIEEQNFILNFVSENGNQWKLIGTILNRNENQIKNEFYRKISITRKEDINEQCSTNNSDVFDVKEEFDFKQYFTDFWDLEFSNCF
jgi:hypothetical protein